MSRDCCVINCKNSDYMLERWKKTHACTTRSEESSCYCEVPPEYSFKLFPFPTEKKKPELRKQWISLVNRDVKKGVKRTPWLPHKNSRVCSRHFVGGKPSEEHPWPTENMGYDPSRKLDQFPGFSRRRVLQRTTSSLSSEPFNDSNSVECSTECGSLTIGKDDVQLNDQHCLSLLNYFFFNIIFILSNLNVMSFMMYFMKMRDTRKEFVVNLVKENVSLKGKIETLKRKISLLEKDCKCRKSFCDTILTSDRDVMNFTGFVSLSVFEKVYSFIRPLVRHKWTGASRSYKIVRKYFNSPKKIGPKSKLLGKDEFLLTMMKIRLGLLDTDLSKRFGVSLSTVSRIFNSYVKSTAAVLKSFVYIPPLESLLATAPPSFAKLKNLHSIIDATEIFLQTPKNLSAQRSTWSEYKHHNTAKILVAISSNSKIIFVSKAYGGRISDKQLTLDSGYLDMVDPHTEIMVDKGFNIVDDCASRFITVHVPPGRRGNTQMPVTDVRQTEKVANLRIIVEQVIRRLKTFQILARELSITATRNIDDMIVICAALVNMHEPIYKN